MNAPITQKQVARIVGVSQATVSLVLSGAQGGVIPKDTADRVFTAARDLGYVPNRFAAALRTSRTMSICCIVPDITNPFYPSLVRGVQAVAEKSGYDVIVANSDGLRSREQQFVNTALQGRVDGIVGVFFSLTAQDLKPLAASGIPVVRVEARRKAGGPLPIDDVYTDNFRAALDITSFLISKGHRKIAMIVGRGGPEEVRVNGYRQAVSDAGISYQVIFDDEFNEHGGIRAAHTLFSEYRDVTAVLASNDMMAIGAMNTAREFGKSIPGDVAIAGFDDIPASSLVYPALTSVAMFQEQLGEVAARQLIGRLSGANAGNGTSIGHRYKTVVREST